MEWMVGSWEAGGKGPERVGPGFHRGRGMEVKRVDFHDRGQGLLLVVARIGGSEGGWCGFGAKSAFLYYSVVFAVFRGFS